MIHFLVQNMMKIYEAFSSMKRVEGETKVRHDQEMGP